MSAIPTKIREQVWDRQDKQCARCGNRGTEIHHRQRRRDGGHLIENCVGLCGTCHRWAHSQPHNAKEAGFIVSPFVEDVASVPLKTFMGWLNFTPEGGMVYNI